MFWLVWFSHVLAGVLLGGVLFTSFLTAPIVFIVLDQATATQFTRKLWPRYFIACTTLGLLLAGLILFQIGAGLAFGFCLGFTLLMASNYAVTTRIRTLRGEDLDAEMEGTVEFLHKLSVWMNYTCLVLMVLVHYFLTLGY